MQLGWAGSVSSRVAASTEAFDGGAAPGSNDSAGRWVFSNKILRKSLILSCGAGNENRTRIASLEGWSFTIKLCPQEPNGKKGCHEVAGSQAVFCREVRALKVRHHRRPGFSS